MAVPVTFPHRGYTKIGKETTRGTAAASMISLPVDSRSLNGKFDRTRPHYMNNSIHEVNPPVAGRRMSQGDLAGPVLVDSIGHVLMAALGQDTVTGAGPYTHTFIVAGTTPTYTIEKNLGGLTGATTSQQYLNMVNSKVTISGRVEQDGAMLEYSSSWLGKAPTRITATGWTEPTEYLIPAALTTFTYGPTPGATVPDLLCEFQITMDRDAQEVKGANNSLDISDAVASIMKISGFIDLYFLDWTKFDDMYNNTEEVVDVKVALSASKSLQLTIPKGYLVVEAPNEGQQFIKQRFNIQGIYDSTGGTTAALKAILVNSQAAGY